MEMMSIIKYVVKYDFIIIVLDICDFMICLDDLRTLGSHYMCDFAQGKCNWTASAGKMKWIEAQVRE